jgi:hypothetical protein
VAKAPASQLRRDEGASPVRAHGRSLADFLPLSSAEEILREGARLGHRARVGEQLPPEDSDANRVRAAFLRFLVLGGDVDAPVHEHPIHLEGAWLSGALDFDAARAERGLLLWHCSIGRIDAHQSSLKLVTLAGCRLTEGLRGDGLRCEGGLLLRDVEMSGEIRLLDATILGSLDCGGSCFRGGGDKLSCSGAHVSGDVILGYGLEATGRIDLIGTSIGGDLVCTGARFENEGGTALACDRAVIAGTVFLTGGFRAKGEVRLPGAKVAGNLDCESGGFDSDTVALLCDRIEISGSVFLRDSFFARGEVSLRSAWIGGSLDCKGGSFVRQEGWALSCGRAVVRGSFIFQAVEAVLGGVDLGEMEVGGLNDDLASWKQVHGLVLDGFVYGRIVGDGAPTDVATRVEWLKLQPPGGTGKGFQPQPWEQLISVFRAMGYPERARDVAMRKQDRLREVGALAAGARPFHWLYGWTIGYGYQPLRLLLVIPAVWFVCTLAYWWAANPGGRFGPSTYLIAPPMRDGKIPAADYPNFVAPIYSADVLLPVVDFGYKDEWQPVVSKDSQALGAGQAIRFLYWFEIAFGWIAGLLLVGVLGNLIKKD